MFSKRSIIFLYYKSQGVPSWEWSYPFHTTPSLKVVSEYIKSLPPEHIPQFELGKPLLPFEQLMAILPRKCANLVPECLVDEGQVEAKEAREMARKKSPLFSREENEKQIR